VAASWAQTSADEISAVSAMLFVNPVRMVSLRLPFGCSLEVIQKPTKRVMLSTAKHLILSVIPAQAGISALTP
jgi:hypothetical protein